MLISLAVVSFAGISALGIYSFIFVVTTFLAAIASTLLHRQMVLFVAAEPQADKERAFTATVYCQSALFVFLFCVAATLISVAPKSGIIDKFIPEIGAAFGFLVTFSFHELFRQYLYVNDKYVYALSRCLLFGTALLFGTVYAVWFVDHDSFVFQMLLCLFLAYGVSVISNYYCIRTIWLNRKLGIGYCLEVARRYWQDGRYRLQGLVLTWAQNQSINPFLMWVSGPLMAGYFSLARLLVMPLATVNQGLITGSVPMLRRSYKSSGSTGLSKQVKSILALILTVSGIYVCVLLMAQYSDFLRNLIPDYQNIKHILWIWIVTIVLSIVRAWYTQYFTVTMKFRFLMQIAYISVTITMLGLLTLGAGLGLLLAAICFVAIGEVVAIAIMHIAYKKVIQQTDCT